jgi:hypothetical protein
MINTKFYELYILLKDSEIKFFRNFILSEIKMKNKNVLALFEYLFSRKYLNENNLARKKVYKYVFEDSVYDDLKMRHLLSEAVETMEYYFSYRKFNISTIQQDIYLIESLIERNSLDLAHKNINNTSVLLEKQLFRNEFYFDIKAKLIHYKYKIETEYTRKKINNYQVVMNAVLQQSMLSVFKHSCLYLVNNQFANNQMETEYVEYLTHEVTSEKYKENTLLQVYYNMYNMLTKVESDPFFYETKKIIDNNNEIVELSELKDIYLILSNYCVKRFNKNELSFGAIYLEIIEYGIQKQFLLDNNELNRFVFTNFITIALKLQHYSKAENFIELYNKLIHRTYRKDTINYNLARLFYIKKEYKNAIRILVTISLQDIFWELNAKVIQLKIYFETNDLDLLDNALFNFTQFIRRKKNIGYHKDYFLSIVKSFKYLLNANTKTKKELKIQIEKMTNSNEPEKDWFVEQLKLILR